MKAKQKKIKELSRVQVLKNIQKMFYKALLECEEQEKKEEAEKNRQIYGF